MTDSIVYRGNHSQIIKMFDRLYFRRGNLEIRGQCNTGIIELKDSAALIDYTDQWPDDEQIDEAEALLNKPVKYIFITHAHGDHISGLKTLKRKDVTLIASEKCVAQIVKEGYSVPEKQIAVTQSTLLELDGVEFKLILPGRTAHSPWDMLVGIPEYKTIFSGDLIVEERYMYFHTSDINGWLKTLDDLGKSGWECICRGHGPAVGGEYIKQAMAYMRLLEQAASLRELYKNTIDVRAVRAGLRNLPSPLPDITGELMQKADAINIARQINQLIERAGANHING